MSGAQSDRDFLTRMDRAWGYVATFCGIFLLPIWSQLFYNFNMRLFAVLLILIGGFVLPFLVEVRAMLSGSAKTRCLSWLMLVSAVIVTVEFYMYHTFWLVDVEPLFVPSIMSHADYAVLFTAFVDAVFIVSGMKYSSGRIINHFLANLETKRYRAQILSFQNQLKRYSMRILLLYFTLVGVATMIIFAP